MGIQMSIEIIRLGHLKRFLRSAKKAKNLPMFCRGGEHLQTFPKVFFSSYSYRIVRETLESEIVTFAPTVV